MIINEYFLKICADGLAVGIGCADGNHVPTVI
jgi:hypothetical protein